MIKRFKTWAYVAALFGGVALLTGCSINSQWATILAILQEDVFG